MSKASMSSSSATPRIAEVVFNISLDKGFDYFIPDALLGQVRPGVRVRVQLKHSERPAYVIAVKSHSEYAELKPILALESSRQQIPAALLRLSDWLADYYCSPARARYPGFVAGSRPQREDGAQASDVHFPWLKVCQR